MKINYSIRPAKSVERKMMLNLMEKMSRFGELRTFQYVGFGAETFRDFTAVHTRLGITDMTSIEVNVSDAKRFEHNKPIDYISMVYGWSWDVLSSIDFSRRSIVWLDYTCSLSVKVLTDVLYLLDNIEPGSMLAVSVNAATLASSKDPLAAFRNKVGEFRVRADLDVRSLQGWGTAQEYYTVLTDEIQHHFHTRNNTKPAGSKRQFKQIMHFQYADGAKMMTLGGVVHDGGQQVIFDSCGFQSEAAYRPSDVALRIEIPELTYTEMRLLARNLKNPDEEQLANAGLSLAHLNQYRSLHPFFPAFTESEL
jgi:hypothetical protein